MSKLTTRKTQIKNINKTQGFSLVELMIGIVVSLLLVAAASTVWLSSKRSYGVQNDLADIQDIGRFAASIIQHEIREAGFLGCVGYDAKDNSERFIEKTDLLDDVPNMTRISGEEGSGSGLSDSSDSFTIWGLNTNGLGVVDDDDDDDDNIISINTASLTLEGAAGFKADQVFGIADCSGGVFYEVDADMAADSVVVELKSTGTSKPRLFVGLDSSVSEANILAGKDPYQTRLFDFHHYTYSIEDLDGDGDTELIRTNADDTSEQEEILPDVENMQILYGLDTDEKYGPDSYVTADNVGDKRWDAVISLKVSLLIRSTENRGLDLGEIPYTLLDKTFSISDKRRRKVISTEVNIRSVQ